MASDPETGAAGAGMLRVEVVCAFPGEQLLATIKLREGATVQDAIECSGLLRRCSLDPDGLGTGIFGKPVQATTLLRDGDRVEIYRPLLADPKQARRERALRRKGIRSS